MSKRTGLAAALGLGGAGFLALWLVRDAGPGASNGAPPLRDNSPATAALVERLQRAELLNGAAIYGDLGLSGPEEDGFLTGSPYAPDQRALSVGEESVRRWHAALSGDTEVCGVRFLDPERVAYRLRTFPDRERALEAGYVVTHRHHCGACSSLWNLAVYLAKPDLTSPARTCARKATATGVKACFMEVIGFDERCAETWTYNALRTRRRCLASCIGAYGLWSVLTNDMSVPQVDGSGNLNPCLACDEEISGPGFQYAAGRTRRSSGLTSTIPRPAAEIYPVDHTVYFRSPDFR